jgi:hypothetical protein
MDPVRAHFLENEHPHFSSFFFPHGLANESWYNCFFPTWLIGNLQSVRFKRRLLSLFIVQCQWFCCMSKDWSILTTVPVIKILLPHLNWPCLNYAHTYILPTGRAGPSAPRTTTSRIGNRERARPCWHVGPVLRHRHGTPVVTQAMPGRQHDRAFMPDRFEARFQLSIKTKHNTSNSRSYRYNKNSIQV